MNNKIKLQHKILSHTNQSGVTFIELLTSMVIGLFLLAGVITNFISTKKVDVKRAAISEMDANATVAFEVLRQSISHAGYPSIENIVPFDKPFFSKEDTSSITNPACRDESLRDVTTIPSGYKTSDINSNSRGYRDILTIVTLADNPCNPGFDECTINNGINVNTDALVYTDCAGGGENRDTRAVACSTDRDSGMSDPSQAKIYSTFKLFKTHNAKDRVLYCFGSRSPVEGVPIIENVEAIQFLYGAREDNSGNIRFQRANQVENNDQWGMVTSVKVGLLLRSSNKFVLDQPSTKTSYQVLDASVGIANADRNRLFRVYTTTINLENKNKGALLPSG